MIDNIQVIYMELAISILEYKHYGVIPHHDYEPVQEAATIIVSRGPENRKIEKLETLQIDVTAGNNALVRIASRNGHLDIVRWLVDRGADITVDDHYCMKWAVRYNHLDIVNYLINQGERITEEHLVTSARHCNLYLFKLLTKFLPLTDCDIGRLVVSAVKGNKQIEILEYLFERGPENHEEILEAAIFGGSVLVTSYILSEIDNADFIGAFIGCTGNRVFDFIETYIFSWIDGAKYLHFILQHDVEERIDRVILIKFLHVLCTPCTLAGLPTILFIVKRCRPTFDELVAFRTFVKEILPYITDAQYIYSLFPIKLLNKQIHRLEHRAAVIIQRAWKNHNNETIWERIKSFGSL